MGESWVLKVCVLRMCWGRGLNHLENFSKAQRSPHTLRCVSGSPLLMGTGAVRQVSQKDAWDTTMPERRVSTAPPWLLTSGSDELDKERLVQASKELGSVNRLLLWRPGASQWRGGPQAGWPSQQGDVILAHVSLVPCAMHWTWNSSFNPSNDLWRGHNYP